MHTQHLQFQKVPPEKPIPPSLLQRYAGAGEAKLRTGTRATSFSPGRLHPRLESQHLQLDEACSGFVPDEVSFPYRQCLF